MAVLLGYIIYGSSHSFDSDIQQRRDLSGSGLARETTPGPLLTCNT